MGIIKTYLFSLISQFQTKNKVWMMKIGGESWKKAILRHDLHVQGTQQVPHALLHALGSSKSSWVGRNSEPRAEPTPFIKTLKTLA